jgi:glycosyltransferase involved in cell wall biosynthesis
METNELIRRAKEGDHTDLVVRLADVLEELISDSNRRRELGENGRDAVLNGALSRGRMRTNLLELYTQAID